ncbi:hypothetical protein [Roseovarius arcticus]|uniref:hypothetical protein n=1 Tax=Roseovarius arcticus TaxID=2547404 RepID=UPI001110914B|nr:hypothetical protein [Roseovarius arcticus]
MKRVFTGAAVVLMVASPAMADEVNSAYAGCVTEKALDEIITAVVNSDKRQIDALTGTICVAIGGLIYSLID